MILDTSIIIAAERETFDLDGLLLAAGDDPVAIAAITATELLHGVERARDEGIRTRRHLLVESILDTFPVIPFGLQEARVHARLWAALAAKGRMIGAHDLQVGATCLSLGSAVATLNATEFRRVPGLSLVPVGAFHRVAPKGSRPKKKPK